MPLVAEGPPKWCPECKAYRPRSDFYARRAPNGNVYAKDLCKEHDKARALKWNRENPERYRATHSATVQRRRNDPERAAIRRDQQREWARRKLGITPDRYRAMPTSGHAGGLELDAAPFAAWLRTLGRTAGEMALACGLNERQVRAYLDGERPTVFEDVVDRALLDFPLRLEDLYPDIYMEDAA